MKKKETAPGKKQSTAKKSATGPAVPKKKKKKKAPLGIQRRKGSEPSRKATARFFRILEMVQRGNYPNAKDFKRELGLSRSTVWRDFDYMKLDHGVPAAFCPKRKGWYFTEPVTSFPALFITESEILAILLAHRAMRCTGNAAFTAPLDRAMEKFGIITTEKVSLRCEEMNRVISFRSTVAEVLIDVDVCVKVCDALMAQEEIELSYTGLKTDPDASTGRMRLQPVHLLCVDSTWYLFAFNPAKPAANPHLYVLSRMKDVVRTGTHFTRPEGFDVDKMLEHSIGVYGGDHPELVHLRLSPRAAIWFGERRFHGTQQYTLHPDGTAELKMNVALNPEVERLILSWGSQVEVLGPASLRQRIWEEAMAIVNRGAVGPQAM